MERTLVILKPSCVLRSLVGEVTARGGQVDGGAADGHGLVTPAEHVANGHGPSCLVDCNRRTAGDDGCGAETAAIDAGHAAAGDSD